MISRILLVSGAVLVFGVVNWQIVANERNRAAGQPVPLALSPVDPRSLMQGDYTRQILATASPKERGIRVAVLALDNRPVGHFVRFDEIAGLFK
jgi:GDYXXLXY protein